VPLKGIRSRHELIGALLSIIGASAAFQSAAVTWLRRVNGEFTGVESANMTCVQGDDIEIFLLCRAGADTPAAGEVSGDSPRLLTVQQLAGLAATMLRLLLELYGAHSLGPGR
jgi:hypothetical protein